MAKKRNIEKEITDGMKEIRAGGGRVAKTDIPAYIRKTRAEMELSQYEFAELLGISKRTLQEWEQGRRQPTGPALRLILIAKKNPKALRL